MLWTRALEMKSMLKEVPPLEIYIILCRNRSINTIAQGTGETSLRILHISLVTHVQEKLVQVETRMEKITRRMRGMGNRF